jgi:hypothetical protein
LDELGPAGCDSSGILGLQQLSAIRAGILCLGYAHSQQNSAQDDSTGEKWQPRSPRIE